LTDVRHVGELLHELATREVLDLPSLLTWLRQQIAETRRDAPEDRARRLDSDAKAAGFWAHPIPQNICLSTTLVLA
ncbi:MAG: hypothetical protein F6K28_58675, partial [Microcoleus sp. SIO2G3]|nr:hypothetical protein [Microcoleus sp. SIO2G3]